MPNCENPTIPPETSESWRTWLMTGARRTPVDMRRMRGANKGLKKILIEGLSSTSESSHRWRDFSGAIVRHAVEDAMRNLPPEETEVVKLAYFGGYRNREIASKTGITEWTVRRRLRRALAAISDQIQHALVVFLSGTWLSEMAAPAAAAAGAAAVILGAQALAGGVISSAPASPATSNAASVVAPVRSPNGHPVGVDAPAAVLTVPPVVLPAVKPAAPIAAKLENLLDQLRP